jgi:hypothetical protein
MIQGDTKKIIAFTTIVTITATPKPRTGSGLLTIKIVAVTYENTIPTSRAIVILEARARFPTILAVARLAPA